jgi:hypothetical protein
MINYSMVNRIRFLYYYNQIPGQTPWRNNLVYTSLISDDKKTFCKWFFNDGVYHGGQNEVVDSSLMESKWNREIKYLLLMSKNYSDLIPEILDIDYSNRKIYLKIDGVDFWQRSLESKVDFKSILPDWQDQMCEILKAHKSLNLYKYSMHPSSYFIVDNKLKSINYFFCYHKDEGPVKIRDHLSHISAGRRAEIKKYTDAHNISWDEFQPLDLIENLTWESFRTNYPDNFIEKAKCIK